MGIGGGMQALVLLGLLLSCCWNLCKASADSDSGHPSHFSSSANYGTQIGIREELEQPEDGAASCQV